MATGQETFTAKLGELEDWYGELRHRVLACQRVDRKALREELKAALEEYREDKVRLQQSVAACRFPQVAEMVRLQFQCMEQMEEKLRKGWAQCTEGRGTGEEQVEAAELYGEYAIDFAVQAVSQAMLAALSALVLQADRRDVLEEGGEQE